MNNEADIKQEQFPAKERVSSGTSILDEPQFVKHTDSQDCNCFGCIAVRATSNE